MSSAETVDLTESKQSELRMMFIAMTIIPPVIVLIRTWSRALLPVSSTSKIRTKFWWDDWTAFVAVAFNIALCVISLNLVDLGLGLHVQAVPREKLERYFKLLWISYFIYHAGTAVSKASALFFYARVFSMTNSRFRHALWLMHGLNAAWLIALLMTITFMCDPIKKAWEVTLPGTCLDHGMVWTGSGVASLVIDIAILVMPLPVLWKLQLKTTRKLQICAVFICGYLVVVVSIGRIIAIVEAGAQLQVDPTYSSSTSILWLSSEIGIATISVSIPSVFSLGQRVYSTGLWSLVSSRKVTPRSGHTDTRWRSNDDEDDGLVMRADASPYLPRTNATAEFSGPNEGIEYVEGSGIHVTRHVEVV